MDLLDGLDAAQHAAVVSSSQPLCILAGAGSGKTRVLTRRIAHRIATGTADAEHVLALTFTRKAAGELRSRLRSLGVRDGVAAGTFHAIALAQLRQRWADRGQNPPVLLERKARLLAPLLPRAQAGGRPSATLQPADLAAEIEWAKARMVAPAGYQAAALAAGRTPPVAAATMAALYQRYEDDKSRKGLVDFEDLLGLCARALAEDPEFAAAQRWRFRHLFVDEFQDVNPVQFHLLQGWMGDGIGRADSGGPDLCVVGDPNQAIYAWNGADPTLLTGFAQRFPGAEVVRLDRNYRSTPQVVAVAGAVLAAGGQAQSAAIHAVRPDGPAPIMRQFDTDVAEAQGVARALRRAHRPGVAWSQIAVLARTNAQLLVLDEHLRAAAIPTRVSGGGSLVRLPEIRAALDQLRQAPGAVAFVSRLADVEALAADGGADERRRNLEALVRLGRDYAAVDSCPSVEGFVVWLGSGGRSDDVDVGADAVELSTFHRAKGLEWRIVVVTGLEKGLVPIGHADSPAAEAEERRLLYVALTRATDELNCTWADRRTFGSRTVNRAPSPYLEPIQSTVAAMEHGGTPAEWKARIDAERSRLRSLAGGRSGDGRGRRSGASGRPTLGDNADPAVLDALKGWRSAAARASGVPAYVIFHDSTLAAVAEARPASRAELLALPGLGPVKAERYGETLLALLAKVAT